jgi:hypothetical protein
MQQPPALVAPVALASGEDLEDAYRQAVVLLAGQCDDHLAREAEEEFQKALQLRRDRDYALALRWLTRSAKHGNPSAQFELSQGALTHLLFPALRSCWLI